MCGIIGGVASNKNIVPILVDGLKKLEYRGYDSAGIAVINDSLIKRIRSVGRVNTIQEKVNKQKLSGSIGIGHTRWATHGGVNEKNAHPHISNNEIVVVHNGIIENHAKLCKFLKDKGYKFNSETDTEVIAHLIHFFKNHETLFPKNTFSCHVEKEMINSILVGLIFDYFLWGVGASDALPPLKLTPIELKHF